MGMIYRPKYKAADGSTRESHVYWLQYFRSGRRIRESANTKSHQAATRLLREREGDIAKGVPISNRTNRVTVDELLADVVTDYRVNGKRSADLTEARIRKHLTPFFGGRKAAQLSTTMVRKYIERRQAASAANATINRELAVLKRAYTLAIQASRVTFRPYIPGLDENNTRTGFFERGKFEEVRSLLAEDLQPMVTCAYITGWRKQEVLGLEWRRVDFDAGIVRLDPAQSKNKTGRVFPFTTELRELFEAQRNRTRALEREQGRIIPWVFHRQGERICDYYTAWRNACRKAGCPGLVPHDFRRSAIRNLVRAGVPETVAMQLSGHKTRAVFDRYNITSEGDLFDAASRLDEFTAKVSAKVVASGGRRRPTPSRK